MDNKKIIHILYWEVGYIDTDGVVGCEKTPVLAVENPETAKEKCVQLVEALGALQARANETGIEELDSFKTLANILNPAGVDNRRLRSEYLDGYFSLETVPMLVAS